MSKAFDAVTKYLIDAHPADWLALLGQTNAQIERIDIETLDADLSTITSQADRVFRVLSPTPMIEHFEMETGHHGAETRGNLLFYSVLLERKFKLPVRTTVILLRKEADSPSLTGLLEYNVAGATYLTYRYHVVRLWEMPVEPLLRGGLGTLPLAPLANVTREELPEVIRRMRERVEAEASPKEQGEIWTSTRILLGLRVSRERVAHLLRGVRHMRDSTTFMEILEEGEAIGIEKGIERGIEQGIERGKAEEAQRILVRAGEKRFGALAATMRERITAIRDVEQLEQLIERVFAIESWEELFPA